MVTKGSLTIALYSVFLLAACGPTTGVAEADSGGNDSAATADTTADVTATDAAPTDAAPTDAAPTDAPAGDAVSPSNPDGGAGATCVFNRDCADGLRCECSETAGCACRPGARGTGRTGVTVCTSGNDCASSLCVEGPDARSYCSDECTTAAMCGGMLPRCIEVSFVGRVCARVPPG